jgi:preprotein translocase subunit SecF
MEFFRIQKDIPFMRHALVFNIISLVTFIVAVFFLAYNGLNLSVEFTGGRVMEINYADSVDPEALRRALDQGGFAGAQVQNYGSSRDVLIRLTGHSEADDGDGEEVSRQVQAALEKADNVPAISAMPRSEYVGPTVGKELASDGAMALLLVVAGIMIYLALRFEWRFAVSAIIANLHDVVIILGFFAFFQWEFSLPVLAAVLAVLGYSVNESVVVFDRVRETFRKRRDLATPAILDHAITSTISRTVITHGSTQVMVLSMLLFGGETLHYFALALTIGICFGIYSSVLVASPMVMWLGVSREQFAKAKVEKQEAVV